MEPLSSLTLKSLVSVPSPPAPPPQVLCLRLHGAFAPAVLSVRKVPLGLLYSHSAHLSVFPYVPDSVSWDQHTGHCLFGPAGECLFPLLWAAPLGDTPLPPVQVHHSPPRFPVLAALAFLFFYNLSACLKPLQVQLLSGGTGWCSPQQASPAFSSFVQCHHLPEAFPGDPSKTA